MGAKTVKKLQIGDLKLEGMPTMVMDHPTVAAIADVVGPVEGLIGFPFFARYQNDHRLREERDDPDAQRVRPGDAMQGMMDKLMGASGRSRTDVLAPLRFGVRRQGR